MQDTWYERHQSSAAMPEAWKSEESCKRFQEELPIQPCKLKTRSSSASLQSSFGSLSIAMVVLEELSITGPGRPQPHWTLDS